MHWRLCPILASVLFGCAAASAESALHGPVLVQARWVGSLGILGEFVTVYADGALVHRAGRYLYEKTVEERRLSPEALAALRHELRNSDTVSVMLRSRIAGFSAVDEAMCQLSGLVGETVWKVDMSSGAPSSDQGERFRALWASIVKLAPEYPKQAGDIDCMPVRLGITDPTASLVPDQATATWPRGGGDRLRARPGTVRNLRVELREQ